MAGLGLDAGQVAVTTGTCRIACVLGLIRRALRLRDRPGVRRVAILASDTGAVPSLMLRDPGLGLRGKPDYVLREVREGREQIVALELKPGRRGPRVFESDAVQVAAYTLMLRATHGDGAASFGYLRTPSRTVRIELTPALTRRIEEIVRWIRRDRRVALVHRSHEVRGRCASCAMRASCDERLE